MSAEIIDASDQTLTWRGSGQLKHSEFAAAQKRAADFIRQQGKVRFLVLVENFAGTEKGGDWGDVSFQADYDPKYRRAQMRYVGTGGTVGGTGGKVSIWARSAARKSYSGRASSRTHRNWW